MEHTIFNPLGIDCGWNLGYYCSAENGTIHYKGSKEDNGKKWILMSADLERIIMSNKISFVAYEMIDFIPNNNNSQHATEILQGHHAVVEMVCAKLNVPCVGVRPKDWKFALFGGICGGWKYRFADKKEVQEKVQRMGHTFSDSNQYDAYGVWHWANSHKDCIANSFNKHSVQ